METLVQDVTMAAALSCPVKGKRIHESQTPLRGSASKTLKCPRPRYDDACRFSRPSVWSCASWLLPTTRSSWSSERTGFFAPYRRQGSEDPRRCAPVHRERTHGELSPVRIRPVSRQPRGRREPVGICGLLKRDTLPDVDVGFAFLSRHWSKGYAVESAAAILDHGRRRLGSSAWWRSPCPRITAPSRCSRESG